MGKATAEAPSNLAFVKYWGKKDSGLRLPCNNSISMNLSNAKTVTTVEFNDDFQTDEVFLESGEQVKQDFADRVIEHIERIRKISGITQKVRVITKNNFPTSVGIASSASGFAALSLAATAALGLKLTERELSSLARFGSGSACRSIPDGFVEWNAGDKDSNSFAVQIAPPEHWDISVVTVILSKKEKHLSSTDGHSLALKSPFFKARLETLPERLKVVKSAILQRDFEKFGQELEMEAISLHTISMTSPFILQGGWFSGTYYWLPETLELILETQNWRQRGINVYFTLDAGPTVHLVCLSEDVPKIVLEIQNIEKRMAGRKWDIMINKPAVGARIVDTVL